MKVLTAILFLALGLPAQGAWVMTGMIVHECEYQTAIDQEYCEQGEKFVADLFVTKPRIIDGIKYNKLIKTGPSIFEANTLIRIPDGAGNRDSYVTVDTFEILERTPGDQIWDATTLLVVNQDGREFVVEKSLAIHKVVMWLRGDWTGDNDQIVDATFRYEKTERDH